MAVRDDLGEWPEPGRHPKEERRLLSNVVLMGMGEPLYNFENVRNAMKIVMDGEGISLSRRRITLSTSGVVPEIRRAGEEIGCRLAVSFHATTDEIRNRLVPINRKWNIETLLDALRSYPGLSNSDRITFEYVMLKDINDSDEDARRLVSLIRGIPAKVNLIPFNAWPGAPYERSDPERIRHFADIIYKAGYASPVRTPRGSDIMAACGQLKSASESSRKDWSGRLWKNRYRRREQRSRNNDRLFAKTARVQSGSGSYGTCRRSCRCIMFPRNPNSRLETNGQSHENRDSQVGKTNDPVQRKRAGPGV